MVAYRIKYKIRLKRLEEWTDWQDKESVIVVNEDALEAIEEIKKREQSGNVEHMVTGIENISKIDIIARNLTTK